MVESNEITKMKLILDATLDGSSFNKLRALASSLKCKCDLEPLDGCSTLVDDAIVLSTKCV